MAYAFVGSAVQTTTNTGIVTRSFTAGNTAFLYTLTSAGGGNPFVTSISDGQGGTWFSAFGTIGTTGNVITVAGFRLGLFYSPNCASGITSVTVNFNGGVPGTADIVAFEYSGLATSSPLIAARNDSQTNPGTGANAVTGTALNVTSQPALFLGCVGSANGDLNSLTAGTGFTSRFKAASTTASWGFLVEDQRLTATGNATVTATDSAGAATTESIFTAAFSEPPAAASPLLGLASPLSGGLGGTSTANEAYTVTQNGQRCYASGTVTQLNANVSSINTATTLYLALYDINGNLLCGGSTPIAVGLNTVTIANGPHVQYGVRYFPVFQANGSFVLTDNGVNFQRNQVDNTTLPLPGTLAVPGTNIPNGAPIMWVAGTLDPGASGTPLGGPPRSQWHWR